MHATTVGVDLAKNVIEVACADEHWRIIERQRLTRSRFVREFSNRAPCRIVMEACGSAHHWARVIEGFGHTAELLPPQYVRAYVRRNKTDAADAAALLEASRSGEIRTVPVRGPEAQALLLLHRARSQALSTRNARLGWLRGAAREFGLALPVGRRAGLEALRAALAGEACALPAVLVSEAHETLSEIRALEARMAAIERTLASLAAEDPVIARLRTIPGIGLLNATALRAQVGDAQRFPSGRHLASWLGLTARERSSGERRRRGRISKRGNTYLRTLLIHAARAALRSARVCARTERPVEPLGAWALELERRVGVNKATVALANKLARIVWATWVHGRPFEGQHAGARARASVPPTTEAAV